MQEDILARVPPGELEDMARTAQNATTFGQVPQPSFAKAAVDALLKTGDTTGDTFMRGALSMSQVPAAVRICSLELWLHQKAGGEIPTGLKDLVELPHGTRVVALTGILQAAAEGKARQQTLAAITGGLIQASQAAAGGMSRRVRRLFGRNTTSGELTG